MKLRSPLVLAALCISAVVAWMPSVHAAANISAGQTIYNFTCSHCHGSPPGADPKIIAHPGYTEDLNQLVLFACSRSLIAPPGGVVSDYSFQPHADAGVADYLQHILTEADYSDLAAYVAAQTSDPWSFHGTVKSADGHAIEGAEVVLSSDYNPGAATRTDAQGNYKFENIRRGEYAVTASHPSYVAFAPARVAVKGFLNRLVSDLNPDPTFASTLADSIDFVAGYNVSGSVFDSQGRGFAGIEIVAIGPNYTNILKTDLDGKYSFALSNQNITLSIAPNFSEYTFNPSARTLTIDHASQSFMDFQVTAYPPLAIKGIARDTAHAAISGVTLSLNELPGVNAVTDGSGAFTFPNLPPGSYTVVPSLANRAFNPSTRKVHVGVGDQTNIVFLGYTDRFVLSGSLTSGGKSIAHASVSIGEQSITTDADGKYSFVVTNGSYTVTPSKTGYSFSPPNRILSMDFADRAGIDFAGALIVPIKVSKSGHTQNDGSSWAEAKLSIQDAIDAVAPDGEVWVAAGTYYERIQISGQSVLGGFSGQERDRLERSWRSNVTMLDGNPIIFGQIGLTPGRMVVMSAGRIDGFTITHGQATNFAVGGGTYGGAVYCTGGTIANNNINGNTSTSGGGGIWALNLNESHIAILNNTVDSNQCFDRGGGIRVDFGASEIVIANNLISNNSADAYAGGLLFYGKSALIANNTIVNNTITNQSNGAGGLYLSGFGQVTNANNIVAFNSSGIFQSLSSGVTIERNNSVFGNNALDYSNFPNHGSDLAVDPKLTADFRLLSNSPLIDAGDDAFAWTTIDLDGEPRHLGAHVDIGADEFPAVPIPRPTLSDLHISNSGQVAFTLTGNDNLIYTIETSTDLVHWFPFGPIQTANGTSNVTDPQAPSASAHFYRVVQKP